MDWTTTALQELRAALLGKGTISKAPPSDKRTALRLNCLPAYEEALVARIAPLCEVLYLTMVVDGNEASLEYQMLRGAVRWLTDGDVPNHVFDELVQRFRHQLQREDPFTRIVSVAAQLADQRSEAEAAFALAVALASAASPLSARELSFLLELRDLMGIEKGHGMDLLHQALHPSS